MLNVQLVTMLMDVPNVLVIEIHQPQIVHVQMDHMIVEMDNVHHVTKTVQLVLLMKNVLVVKISENKHQIVLVQMDISMMVVLSLVNLVITDVLLVKIPIVIVLFVLAIVIKTHHHVLVLMDK